MWAVCLVAIGVPAVGHVWLFCPHGHANRSALADLRQCNRQPTGKSADDDHKYRVAYPEPELMERLGIVSTDLYNLIGERV